MKPLHVVMTAVLAVIIYFLAVAFAGFGTHDPMVRLAGIAGIVGVSFLVVRKLFP